jgi:hypothetical protein
MKTNVNTTGGGAAQPENTETLRRAYAKALDVSVMAVQNLEYLGNLFKVIGSLAKAGDLEGIAFIAGDGEYHAEDWSCMHDCEREEIEAALTALRAGAGVEG